VRVACHQTRDQTACSLPLPCSPPPHLIASRHFLASLSPASRQPLASEPPLFAREDLAAFSHHVDAGGQSAADPTIRHAIEDATESAHPLLAVPESVEPTREPLRLCLRPGSRDTHSAAPQRTRAFLSECRREHAPCEGRIDRSAAPLVEMMRTWGSARCSHGISINGRCRGHATTEQQAARETRSTSMR